MLVRTTAPFEIEIEGETIALPKDELVDLPAGAAERAIRQGAARAATAEDQPASAVASTTTEPDAGEAPGTDNHFRREE